MAGPFVAPNRGGRTCAADEDMGMTDRFDKVGRQAPNGIKVNACRLLGAAG
jgi:hypothetical protein